MIGILTRGATHPHDPSAAARITRPHRSRSRRAICAPALVRQGFLTYHEIESGILWIVAIMILPATKHFWQSSHAASAGMRPLVAYLLVALGLPLPNSGARAGKPGPAFPCQHHACGCQTAEPWRGCCCFTPRRRWDWADGPTASNHLPMPSVPTPRLMAGPMPMKLPLSTLRKNPAVAPLGTVLHRHAHGSRLEVALGQRNFRSPVSRAGCDLDRCGIVSLPPPHFVWKPIFLAAGLLAGISETLHPFTSPLPLPTAARLLLSLRSRCLTATIRMLRVRSCTPGSPSIAEKPVTHDRSAAPSSSLLGRFRATPTQPLLDATELRGSSDAEERPHSSPSLSYWW